MNVCRYITGIESLFFSHIMIWGSIMPSPPPYGAFLIIYTPKFAIELKYPGDLRRKRRHDIYVMSYFPDNLTYNTFASYYIADPNMRNLKVVL